MEKQAGETVDHKEKNEKVANLDLEQDGERKRKMKSLRHDLQTLRPLKMPQTVNLTGHSEVQLLIYGNVMYRKVVNGTGQTTFKPFGTVGQNTTSGDNGQKKYKRQSNFSFKYGSRVEYEEFKYTLYNMRNIFCWNDDQFGK